MFHVRIFMMALRGLRQNMLRSLLATLGVIIGVGAVISAMSILEGARKDILGKVEKLGADQIMIFAGAQKHGGRATVSQSLTPEDADRIESDNIDLISRVSPQFQQPGQIKYYENNVIGSILGVTETYSPLNDYKVVAGRFVTREDVRGNAMVCVLGYQVAHDIFAARDPIGEPVKINGKGFIVIGVMEEKGTLGFQEVDKQVIVPLGTAMGRLFGSRRLSMIVAQCNSTKQVPACIERVKRSMRASHRVRAGDGDDFTVFTQEQFKQQFGQIAKIFGVVLYSIAGISLVVGAIGIMNIMLVSVTERTREIGVRIAVGARRFDILKQFLAEAGVISLCGGALGVLCGWAMANFLGEFTQVLKTHTPPLYIALALVMAIVVGIVSGLYPAIRASRLDPVEALRFE